MRNKDTSNLIFSAFLVTAFVICSYFFSILINDSTTFTQPIKSLLKAVVFAVFGLVLFYATRVGEGKQVKRFSLSTLIIMVLPSLYIIVASVVSGIPFSEQIQMRTEIMTLAAVSFGYGIPYTFLSGYELETNEYQEDSENGETETDISEETEETEKTEETESDISEDDEQENSIDNAENADGDETDSDEF